MARAPSALITGVGGALAEHVVAAFEAAGWRLALVSRRGGDMPGVDAARQVHAADLTSSAAAAAVVARAEADLDGLDAVVNLAGGFARVAAVESTLDDLDDQLARNLRTAVTTTTAALPGMLRRGGGTVVCVAAAAAVDGAARAAPYAAAKAAVAAYFRSIDRELAREGIRALVVFPMGTIDSAADRAAMPDADPARWIDPVVLADALVRAVATGPRGRLRELRVFPDG